jgi:hypothetical protein
MRLSRRTLALPCALLLSFAGAASAQAAITITSPANGGYTNDLTPVVEFTGAAAVGAVRLEVDAVVLGSTTADGFGDGSVSPDADITSDPIDDDGEGNPIGNRFGLTLRDPDGDSPNLDTITVHIDQVPSIATSTHPQLAENVSFSGENAIPEQDVRLYIDGDLDSTVSADTDGSNTEIVPTAELTPGSHTAYMTSVDADGFESSPSETANFDVAPPAPAFSQFFENVQLNQTQPPVTFHDVDPAATRVTLYHLVEISGTGTEVEIGHTTVVTNGTATITPSTPFDSREYLIAKQTVGGVETVDYLGDNGPLTAVVNTSAPVLEFSYIEPLTNDNRPYFYAENALENLGDDNDTSGLLYIDGVPAGHADGDGGGNVGIQPDAAVAEGPHTAYVVTVDDLGHESAVQSNAVDFTVDSVAPAAPTVTSPANGSTTATSLPVVTVTTEPGAIAHVLVDDVGEEADQTADSNGKVTFTLTQALADGGHALHVWSRDAAGNYGDLTATTFTVATPKAPPVVVAPPVVTPPVTTTPKNPVDLDGDGITNNWLVGGKAAPAPGTPKAKVSSDKVELKLAAAPKGATKVRVYRADGKGGFKLVKTLTVKSKTFTD